MASGTQSRVLPLRVDIQTKEVWKGKSLLKLTRRAFDVLCCLLHHKGRLVTKEILFKAVWEVDGVVVGDAAITTCIREIRKALNENAKDPQYIQTASRYGYRFIGPMANPEGLRPLRKAKSKTQRAEDKPAKPVQPMSQPSSAPVSLMVGRESEFANLCSLLERMLAGERQTIFVTGEAGIGKTTIVKAFLRHVATTREIGIAYGQCIEQFGPGEAYRPVLEAIGRACRDPRGAFLVEWMKHHIPTWLMQMPTLVKPEDLDALRRTVQGATKERMLREMSEGADLLTEHLPFILVLEDLHWSDTSTIDLLAALARRQERARLMVIATYRPEEALTDGHPLRSVVQELRGHKQCQEIALAPLDAAAVTEYVEKQFPTAALPTRLPQLLYQNTGGNPLFLAAIVDDLKERKVMTLVEDGQWTLHDQIDAILADVPVSIRQLLDRQISQLSVDEQQFVQAASMIGLEFSSAAVAAAVGAERATVEAKCEGLVRRQHFLQPAGYSEWPDGVRAARYRFRHAIYQYLWAERVPVSLQQHFHLRIGERLERAYGANAGEVAAELAVHFEQGGEYQRALAYVQQAAVNAIRRYSHREAITHLTKGLELLSSLSSQSIRVQQELNLRVMLGAALIVTKGYSAPEVESSYGRALELCRQVEESPQLLQALWGLESFYAVRGKFQLARQISEQCLLLVESQSSPDRRLRAHWTLGQILSHVGELAAAREHLQKALTLYRPREHPSHALQDAGVTSLAYLALILWTMGYADQASARIVEALRLAEGLAHPFSQAFASTFAATIYVLQGHLEAARKHAQATTDLSKELGFPSWFAFGTVLRGRTLWMQGHRREGIGQMRQGIDAWKRTGAEASQPLALAFLAEAYKEEGMIEEAHRTIAEAELLVEKNGEQYCSAELYRVKGELILHQFKVRGSRFNVENLRSAIGNLQLKAEECFQKAIDIACQQDAKSLELRAVMSMSRLWQSQGRTTEAKLALSEIYYWFSEGLDTADLREAKALLDMLSENRRVNPATATTSSGRKI